MNIEIQNKTYNIIDMHTIQQIEGIGIVIIGDKPFKLTKPFVKGRLITEDSTCLLSCDFFLSPMQPNKILTRNPFSSGVASKICAYFNGEEEK